MKYYFLKNAPYVFLAPLGADSRFCGGRPYITLDQARQLVQSGLAQRDKAAITNSLDRVTVRLTVGKDNPHVQALEDFSAAECDVLPLKTRVLLRDYSL